MPGIDTKQDSVRLLGTSPTSATLPFTPLFFFFRKVGRQLYCFGETRDCSGALDGVVVSSSPSLACHLDKQGGTGSADGGQGVLVLSDRVPDTADLGIFINGGTHIGSGRLSLAGSLLYDHHDALPSTDGSTPIVLRKMSPL